MPHYLVKGAWTIRVEASRIITADTPEAAMELAKGPGSIDTDAGVRTHDGTDGPVWEETQVLDSCEICKQPATDFKDAHTPVPEKKPLRVCRECWYRFCTSEGTYYSEDWDG